MPIFTALSTFNFAPLDKAGKCTACNRTHEAGAEVLWKTYRGKFRQINRVILCDENCHADYDDKFWSGRIAAKRAGTLEERRERLISVAEKEGYATISNHIGNKREVRLEIIEREEVKAAHRNYELPCPPTMMDF